MIKSLPINNKSRQEELCRLAGIAYNSAELAYEIEFGQGRNGILTFAIRGERGIITNISEYFAVNAASRHNIADKDADFERDTAFFIAARGCLNFLDLHGIHDVFYENVTNDTESLVKMIGFKRNSYGSYYLNLRGFFDGDMCKK